MSLAPIAIIAYRRPEHTRRLIESLLANPEAVSSPIYAFSDGPKSPSVAEEVAATRAVLRDSKLPNLTLVERESNVGLARNIIDAVTRLTSEHGSVIVLEDDLVLSPTFLEFMNAALDRYRESQSVFHINGYMYPVTVPARGDVLFLPFISSSGWATWRRAWEAFDADATGYVTLQEDEALRRRFDLNENYRFFDILRAQMERRVDSWAIRWYLSMFMHEGLSVFPRVSLVENVGFGEGATHTALAQPRQFRAKANAFRPRIFPDASLDEDALAKVRSFLGWELSPVGRLTAKAERAVRILKRVMGLRS